MKKTLFRIIAVVGLVAALVQPSAVGAVDGSEPVTTVAGGNGAGAATNQLSSPYHATVDDDGVLYVADVVNDRVLQVDASGTPSVVTISSGAGASGDVFGSVDDVAIGPDDALYVVDAANGRVVKIEAGVGTEITTLLNDPTAIDFDDAGEMYVADAGTHTVVTVNVGTGALTTVAGGGGQGNGLDQLDSPSDIAFSSGDVLHVADTVNNRVVSVDGAGDGTVEAGTGVGGSSLDQLNNPQGVGFDPDGELYVADTFNHRVVQIDTATDLGTIVTGDGQTGTDPGELNAPTDVTFDALGSMYVVDFNNHRVQKSTIADTTDPVATITSPTNGDTIDNGAAATIVFSCTDEGSSGLASCVGDLNGSPVTSGTAVDTATAGANTLQVTATDGSGNSDVATVSFSVAAADPEPEPEPEPGPRELTGDFAGDTGIDGSISRLYMAVFTRQPDAGGHAYWVDRGADELSLREIARFFVFSPEFVETYGELSDADFVDLLYINVMNRAGDAGGVAFWNEQLANGMSRSEVVLLFSESPEFKVLTGTD